MEPKTYGLDTLALICADDISRTLPHFKVKKHGLYLRKRKRTTFAVGTPLPEIETLRWHAGKDEAMAALPIPFTAYEFAAFTLAGMGLSAIERFERLDDEDVLNEAEMTALGSNGGDAREVLREAQRLRLDAYRQQRIEDGRNEDQQPRDADVAAAWLLNDAYQEVACAAVTPGPKDAELAPRPGSEKRWTDERIEDLRTYRDMHGTKAAAEKYGISTARVRALQPGDKPKPKGYSAFNQGPK